MTNKDKILKSLRFIESNLKLDVSVSDIAKECYCSLYHFIRLFKSITGISPKKYILKRRLTESLDALRNSDKKIATIAFDYQFSSHEVFTRSFQKNFGISPSKVSRGETVPIHLLVREITKEYVLQSKEARNKPPELIELKERILAGLSYFVRGNLEELDLTYEWKEFMKIVNLIENKTINNEFYQIQYWSEHQEIEGMHFFIGTEVKSIKGLSPEFVVKIIPQGSYLKFIHKGMSRNVGFTYRYIYEEFLPETEYNLSKPFNFEYYGEKYLSPNNNESESILFIPIKK